MAKGCSTALCFALIPTGEEREWQGEGGVGGERAVCTCDSDCGGACQDVLAALQQEMKEELQPSKSSSLEITGRRLEGLSRGQQAAAASPDRKSVV